MNILLGLHQIQMLQVPLHDPSVNHKTEDHHYQEDSLYNECAEHYLAMDNPLEIHLFNTLHLSATHELELISF